MKKRIAIFLSVIMLLSVMSSGVVSAAGSNPSIYRLGGSNRYSTAIRIAENGWTSADTVVLANATTFADALAGVPLATLLDAPILLTQKDRIDNDTLEAIKNLGVENVYILGGTGAISKTVENKLKGYQITRIAGSTRYETSIEIAKEMEKLLGYDVMRFFVVSANNYPDALSVSSVAGIMECPIIYAPESGTIDSNTAAYIGSAYREKAMIIGGPYVIGDSVRNSIVQAGADSYERIYGSDRYETCAKVYERYGFMFDFSTVSVATGASFPDALAGGVFAAKKWIPLILIDNKNTQAPIRDLIRTYNPETVYAFGGQSVVSEITILNLYRLTDTGNTGNTGNTNNTQVGFYFSDSFPKEVSHGYQHRGKVDIYRTIKINEVSYSVREPYIEGGTYFAYVTINGVKTYDADGPSNIADSSFNIIVRDESGIVVDTRKIYTSDVRVGDSFREKYYIGSYMPGEYSIELADDL